MAHAVGQCGVSLGERDAGGSGGRAEGGARLVLLWVVNELQASVHVRPREEARQLGVAEAAREVRQAAEDAALLLLGDDNEEEWEEDEWQGGGCGHHIYIYI